MEIPVLQATYAAVGIQAIATVLLLLGVRGPVVIQRQCRVDIVVEGYAQLPFAQR